MPNLKVDLLPEINSPPRILSNFAQALVDARIKNELEVLLKNPREMQHLLPELLERIQLPPQDVAIRGTKYNIPLMNALVLFAGSVALSSEPSGRTPMDLFRFLSVNLDNEGRYFLFNAIANQLRYPNNHTHYFSMVLLVLFQDAPEELIQEQITRVLLERLIAHRPHPWGLLITFIELIKNPRYDFWNRPFTRCSPEIERVFLSVARSCVPQSTQSTPS
jgi:CCR4-NOT transcription complex subunit 1